MTTEMAAVLSLLVGLGVGVFGAKALFAQARDTRINVYRDAQGWHSTTNDQRVSLRKLMFMRWRIQERTALPPNSRVELRFHKDGEEQSPFTVRRPVDDGRPGNRVIGALVPIGAGEGRYKYTVFLVEGAAETPMEDPEIIIEGKRVHLSG